MPDDVRSQEAVNQLMSNYDITRPTAEFIYDRRSVPPVGEFPDGTPEDDLIHLLMKTRMVDEYEASFTLANELGTIPISAIVEERVNLDFDDD